MKGKEAYFQVYEQGKDRLNYLWVEPWTGEKLGDRRELAKILLDTVWISRQGEIRIEGHIPEVQEEAILRSSLPRQREPKICVPFTIEIRAPLGAS